MGKTKELGLPAALIVWNEPEVRINIVYNIVASTDLKLDTDNYTI
jgi:hypothetical protein